MKAAVEESKREQADDDLNSLPEEEEEKQTTRRAPVAANETKQMEVKPDEIKRAQQELKAMNDGREPTLSELEQYFNDNGVSKDKLMPPREAEPANPALDWE